jgi:hypothetical protein
MKKVLIIFSLFLLISIQPIVAQETEILVVGTLHDVPKGIEHNYDSLLEMVLDWKPQTICTEYRKPKDSVSVKRVYGENIYLKMDSIARAEGISLKNAKQEISKLYASLNQKEDLKIRLKLRKWFRLTMDRGNFQYQSYLIFQHIKELDETSLVKLRKIHPDLKKVESFAKKNNTDEYWCLVFPLAQKLNISYLHPTDDQSLATYYQEAWDGVEKDWKETEIQKAFDDFRSGILKQFEVEMPKGRAGFTVNSYGVQKNIFKLESGFYPRGISKNTDLMSFYFTERNMNMTRNILEVVKPKQRTAVFYGSSHVTPTCRQLKENSPYKILRNGN